MLPAELRRRDGIEPGQEFDVERLDRGKYLLTRRRRRNVGLVELLLACPVKGWFEPMDRCETTDGLRLTADPEPHAGDGTEVERGSAKLRVEPASGPRKSTRRPVG